MEVTVKKKTSEQKCDSEAKAANPKAVGDESAWPEQAAEGGGNSKLETGAVSVVGKCALALWTREV